MLQLKVERGKVQCTSCNSIFNHDYKSTHERNMDEDNMLKPSMLQQKCFIYSYFGTCL